jgi:uncharacterized membrane protein
MESRIKLLGHPVHPMLITVPAGLFIVAAVLDIVDAFVAATWISTVTYWNIAIGIVAAVVAAIFGAADWTNIPRYTRAKKIGAIHGLGNLAAVSLFFVAIMLRMDELRRAPSTTALALEVIAFALLGVSGWLGGELVDRLGVGVDKGAHLDAPSSLRVKHVTGGRH